MNTKYDGLLADLNKLNEVQAQINAEAKNLKSELEEYIKDQSIPVLDRYAVWANAPIAAKREEEDWVQHFNYAGREICWYDDCYKERGTTIILSNLIEELEYHLEHNLKADRQWVNKMCGVEITREHNDKFIEGVLATNIHSFCNDW